MRQWWGKLLFMHWPVAVSALRPLVPPQLSVDTYNGQAWVAVVPFKMWGVRPYFTPPVPGLNTFLELNVRTYVRHRGVPGVWFFSLDIDSPVARWGGRQFFFLPYHSAEMSLRQEGARIDYASARVPAGEPAAAFRADWTVREPLPRTEPDSLEHFLTERYCLYTVYDEQLYRCRVFHEPWPLRAAEVGGYESTMLEAAGIPAPEPRLVATFRTKGPALAVSKGLDRDRAADESGNQLAVFGRRGARPFNLAETQRLYLLDGRLRTVLDPDGLKGPPPRTRDPLK